MDNINVTPFISINDPYETENQVYPSLEENKPDPNTTINSQNIYSPKTLFNKPNSLPDDCINQNISENYNQNAAPEIYIQNTQKDNQNSPPQNYISNITPEKNYVNENIFSDSNPYYPQQGYQPYNQIISVQGNPYNQNKDEIQPNTMIHSKGKCFYIPLLIMSILMFIIIIVDVIIFIIFQYGDGIIFTLMDDIGFLICAIIFLLSYKYSISNQNKINHCLRTILTIAALIFGFLVRVNGIRECEKDKEELLTILMGKRTFINTFFNFNFSNK